MSMVEELKELIAQSDYMRAEDIRSWVRDHGQALVEALENSERYKHVRDSRDMNGFWICHGIFGEGASRWTGEHADRQIDLARTKAGAGGGA